jgi:hypothetical protein
VGDFPKPPDDTVWTEVERSFFAGAPPEPPGPPGEPPRLDDVFPTLPPPRPRREIIAPLKRSVAAAWRRTTLVLGSAGGHALRRARAGAGALVAALSISPINRRRAGSVLVGAIAGAGLSIGIFASLSDAPTNAVAPQREAAESVPVVAQAVPVGAPASRAAPRAGVRSAAEGRARRAEAPNRRLLIHRRPAPAAPTVHHPVMTAFEDRETYWARARQSAPAPASRPIFSR